MSTFKNIQGKNIRSYANNAPNPKEGEMWYNRTEQKLKGSVLVSAWSSGGNTNTALGSTAGSGSQTAGIVFSGADNLNNTELYNGSSWTAAPTLGQGRYAAGEATNAPQTTALVFGGVYEPPTTNVALTEEWNGTNWSTTGATMGTPRNSYGMGGTTTAGLAFGGSPYTTATEEFTEVATTKTFTTN